MYRWRTAAIVGMVVGAVSVIGASCTEPGGQVGEMAAFAHPFVGMRGVRLGETANEIERLRAGATRAPVGLMERIGEYAIIYDFGDERSRVIDHTIGPLRRVVVSRGYGRMPEAVNAWLSVVREVEGHAGPPTQCRDGMSRIVVFAEAVWKRGGGVVTIQVTLARDSSTSVGSRSGNFVTTRIETVTSALSTARTYDAMPQDEPDLCHRIFADRGHDLGNWR